MSGKIKAKCALCGAEKDIPAKPAPKNAKEKKEIAWRCGCGAVMLRDGTGIYRKGLPPEAGSDDPVKKEPEPARQPPPEKSHSGPIAPFSVLAALAGIAVMVSRGKKALPAEPVKKSPQVPGKTEVNYLGPVR